MSSGSVLEVLSAGGLTLSVSTSGGLLVQPRGLITDEHRRLLRENKQGLIAILTSIEGANESAQGAEGAVDARPWNCLAPWRPATASASEGTASSVDTQPVESEEAASTSVVAVSPSGATSPELGAGPGTEPRYYTWTVWRDGEGVPVTTVPAATAAEVLAWVGGDRADPEQEVALTVGALTGQTCSRCVYHRMPGGKSRCGHPDATPRVYSFLADVPADFGSTCGRYIPLEQSGASQ